MPNQQPEIKKSAAYKLEKQQRLDIASNMQWVSNARSALKQYIAETREEREKGGQVGGPDFEDDAWRELEETIRSRMEQQGDFPSMRY